MIHAPAPLSWCNAKTSHRTGPTSSRALYIVWAACALLVLTACGTLPDASKLVSASVQLRSAVAASGSAVEAELKIADRDGTAKEFATKWVRTDESCAGLASYAEALGGIVKAGKEGGAAAQQLADAGLELASGVGVPLPAVAGPLIKLATTVYDQIAKARAAKSLEESLDRMQPAVDAISKLIVSQLNDAEVVLIAANKLETQGLRLTFSDDIGYELRLEKERKSLYMPAPLSAATSKQLEQIDRAEQIVKARLAPMRQELAESAIRLRLSTQLIDGAKVAVIEWAGAHRQMLIAVRESRGVDPQALIVAIEELHRLLIKVKEAS